MVSHRIRIWHSETGSSGYHGWLDTWLTNMQPWSHDEVDNTLPELTSDIDGNNQYYQGELAFDWNEDKAIILDNLDQYMASYCDWHRLKYHVCEHDEENGGACNWEETRENGTVPSYIP